MTTALQDFFDEKARLPTPPVVALKILKAVQSNDNCFDELAEIIMVDPALTARILRIANSSLYGLPKQVNSIAHATSLIGTQTLKSIALSFVFVQKFQEVDIGSFNLELFWRRAISAAVAAEILSGKIGYKDSDIFVSALLQDIGVLILFLSDAASYSELIDNKRVSGKSTCRAEKERFDLNHAEISSHLLESWDLSDTIYGPIFYHHNPESADIHKQSARILYFADKVSAIYHGTKSNLKSIEVHQGLSEEYQFSDQDIDLMIDTIGERAHEVMNLFDIDPGGMKPLSLMIQEAKDELRHLNFSYEQIVLELKQAKQNAEKLAVDLKQSNAKLRELAIRDELTGLFNHRYFQDQLKHEVDSSSRYGYSLSLLLLDIDYFKKTNDTYGHLAGDHVLREMSKLLTRLVRNCDIVARYGGEEFGIILPMTESVGAKVLAQRVRRGVEQCEFRFNNQIVSVTVSIGVSSSDMTKNYMSRTELIAQSDQALYKAKREGRNRVVY